MATAYGKLIEVRWGKTFATHSGCLAVHAMAKRRTQMEFVFVCVTTLFFLGQFFWLRSSQSSPWGHRPADRQLHGRWSCSLSLSSTWLFRILFSTNQIQNAANDRRARDDQSISYILHYYLRLGHNVSPLEVATAWVESSRPAYLNVQTFNLNQSSV